MSGFWLFSAPPIYVIKNPGGGINVNEELAKLGQRSPYPLDAEIAFPGGVDRKYIRSAIPVESVVEYKYNKKRNINIPIRQIIYDPSNIIPNPNYEK